MSVARNNAEIAWPGASGGAIGQDAMYVGVWDAMTNGNFLFGVQISNNPSPLALGEVYYIDANGLAITQTAATNESERSAGRGLAGRLDGTTYGAIHTDDPGTTGVNESALARVSVASTVYTITDA